MHLVKAALKVTDKAPLLAKCSRSLLPPFCTHPAPFAVYPKEELLLLILFVLLLLLEDYLGVEASA